MTAYTDIELLGLLQEEAAEVIQIISKIRRFGADSYNPYDPSGKNNKRLLEDELGDFLLLVTEVVSRDLADDMVIDERMEWKRGKLIENGVLEPLVAPEVASLPMRKYHPVTAASEAFTEFWRDVVRDLKKGFRHED